MPLNLLDSIELGQMIAHYLPKAPASWSWHLLKIDFRRVATTYNRREFAKSLLTIFGKKNGAITITNDHDIYVLAEFSEILSVSQLKNDIEKLIPDNHLIQPDLLENTEFGICCLVFSVEPLQQLSGLDFIAKERLARRHDLIMIADDDLYMRTLITAALKGSYKIIEFEDGNEIVKNFVSHAPDMLLLDIHLPNKLGPQILKEILQIDPSAYVVMISSDTSQEAVLDCVRNGAKGFIAKPFRKDRLIDYITKCPTIRSKSS